MTRAGCILVVDDDAAIREMLAEYLVSHGYAVALAGDGTAMRAQLEAELPDLVLLDLRLPQEDGLSLARYLRERYDVGIIMVTGAAGTVDRIVGLEMGADDYVAKPFEPRELLARIHALLRRSSGTLAPEAAEPASEASATPHFAPPGLPVNGGFGGWQIDWRNRMLISPEGMGLSLSNVEYRLLAAFAEHPGEVLSRGQLVEMTRSAASENNERSIDLAVSRLRAKLRESLENPQFIRTVRGRGYQFTAELAR